MATNDAFTRMMGTKSAGVLVGQDLSGAGTKVSSTINCGSSGADADHGLTPFMHGFGAQSSKQPRLVFYVTEAFTLLTNVTFTARQGSDDPITADIVDLAATTTVLADCDAIGDVVMDIPLPEITDQFLGIIVSHTGTNPGAGRVAGGIQLGRAKGHGIA